MSRTECHTGKAIVMNKEPKETTMQLAERILKNHNIEKDIYYSDALECLRNELHNQYFHHEKADIIYSINDSEFDPNEDIIIAKRLQPNLIEYDVRFYNGGAGLEECLEEAFDNLLKSEEED